MSQGLDLIGCAVRQCPGPARRRSAFGRFATVANLPGAHIPHSECSARVMCSIDESMSPGFHLLSKHDWSGPERLAGIQISASLNGDLCPTNTTLAVTTSRSAF